MAYNYAIRIQALDGYDGLIQSFFADDRFTETIRVHHTGKHRNNPHYHLCVKTDYSQAQTLRKAIQKTMNKAKGNKHVSVKAWDGEVRAVAYLFHEGTEPDMIRGIPQSFINEARMLNQTIQEEIEKNTVGKVCDEATLYFAALGKKVTDPMIFSYLYDRYHKTGDWLPNRYQFERYIVRIRANLAQSKETIYCHKKELALRYQICDYYTHNPSDFHY